MLSWLINFCIILLISTTFIQAQFRANTKLRYPPSNVPFVPSQLQYRSGYGSNVDSLKESRSTSTIKSTNHANEEQLEQFTRLLFDRLNLKEVPNVTKDVHDGTGIPSIVKQLEKEHYQHNEDSHSHHQQQQKNPEEVQATAERAILTGGPISSYTCHRQLAVQLNLNKENLHNIDCFRFTKTPNEIKSLPINQQIKQLRIYVKKNYFYLNNGQEHILTPDMFQVYLAFRPISNDTSHKPSPSFVSSIRLSISQFKQLERNWFELTIDPNSAPVPIQQIYNHLISPWYGLAINHVLQPSWPSFYRRYYSKKHLESLLHSDDEENENKESQQLPYMLVEYGKQLSSSGRGTRQTNPVRPPSSCDPKSPCCRRSLTIDLNQLSALDFVIYPRQIDIGECVGLCGASGSSLKYPDVKNAQHKNEAHGAYNVLAFYQNSFKSNRTTSTQNNKPDEQSNQCCSFSRTGGLEVMYTTTNGGPIIRKYIPNMIVEQCRCGLPAIIHQAKLN